MVAVGEKCRVRYRPPASTDEMEQFQRVVRVLEGKWKREILWRLSWGPKRFGELRRLLPGITQHMLTRRLRELELVGLVTRKVYEEVPPRVEYDVTQLVHDLAPMFDALVNWAHKYEAHLDTIDGRRRATFC